MQQTPLIDREIFFGNPQISGGQLSPDGKKVSFMKGHNGILNLWVKEIDQDFDDAILLTDSKSPILGSAWTRDSKYILYVNDKGGDENINIYAIDPYLATAESVPESRNLTPLEDVTAQFYQISKLNPDKVKIGLNNRDKAWHDLYELTISTGELKLLFENTNRYTGYYFDWDEQLRAASRTDEDGNNQLYAIEADGTFREIYSTSISESAGVVGWTPDNSSIYLSSNKGEVNLTTLYRLNITDGSIEHLESDPQEKVDFGSLWLHKEKRHIISTSYTYHKTQRYFQDAEFEQIYNHLAEQFAGKEVGFVSFTQDYQQMLISVSSDQAATEVYYYDVKRNDLIHQYTPRPELKAIENHLVPMTPISYPSSDGLTIPGYLTLPSHHTPSSPAVVLVHGGPKGPRDYWGYNSTVQFLANRGYVVLQPNFRASGGFGKAYLNAGDKQWGKLMQDDITWGVKYLIDSGLSPKSKIGIMGGSYGGYATLAGLAFTPEVYACGVDIVGPSNLFTLLDSIPAYWEAGRKWLHQMVGDPETLEGVHLLTAASPLFSADQINKPLLIIQGANDPRVKQAESDQIVIALRDQNHPVTYLCADDEGHGFRKPLNRMAMNAEIERFLKTHLGGRCQMEMSDDVKATLDNIKVDIKSVKLAEPPTANQLTELKAHTYTWSESTTQYAINLSAMGQDITLDLQLKIEADDEVKSISIITNSPMGKSTDKLNLKSSFEPLSRTLTQADTAMSISYDGNKAKIASGDTALRLESESIILPDGLSGVIYLSQIGLVEGESLRYTQLDVSTLKLIEVIVTRLQDDDNLHVYQYQEVDDAKAISTYKTLADGTVIDGHRVIPAMEYAVMKLSKT